MKILLSVIFFLLSSGAGIIFYRKRLIFWLPVSMCAGAIFYYGYSAFPVVWMAAAGFLILILILASLEDMKDRTVDIVHLAGALAGVFIIKYLDWKYGWLDWRETLIAFFCGAAVLGVPFLLTRGKSLGSGDVILFMILSILLDPLGVFIVVALAGLFSVAGYFIQVKRKLENKKIALVPALSAAFVIYIPLKLAVSHWLS